MGRREPKSEPEKLIAKIEHVEPSYYISGDGCRTGDEATLDITATIERISPRHKQHIGQTLEITLLISRSFDFEDPKAVLEKPHLFSIHLRKDQRSILAYLPSDAFWRIPQMIDLGATHIETRFTPMRRGSGEVQSLHVAPLAKALSIGWN